MSEFKSKVITTAGQNLLAQNILGANINFTKIVLGDGSLVSGAILSEITEVINPIIEIPITKFHQNGDNAIVVGGMFSNTQITEGFFYRELGLYADGGAGEVLYCYGNAEENADWIPPSVGNAVIEKFIEVLTVIGNSGNATANIVKSATADEIYSDSSYTGIEGTDNVEDALKYIKENMITPQEKTTLGKLIHDGVKLNDLENVEITQFDKPTLPVVSKQGVVKNYDVFNVNEITQKELTGTIANFTSANISSSSEIVTYCNDVSNETFEIYTDGRIVLKNDISELNITLHSNITFAHKRGDKYLAYTLQKYNEVTSVFEDLFVGEEIRVLANNDTNLNVEVEEYLREQPLSAGTYRVRRRYRNNKTTCSYEVTGGTVILYTDETLAYSELKEELIPTSIKNSLKQLSNPNILINSNFIKSVLINQRGQSHYENAQGYTIDMWRTLNNQNTGITLDLEENNIKLTSTLVSDNAYSDFFQQVENYEIYKNKTVTITIDYELSMGSGCSFRGEGLPLQERIGNGIRKKESFTVNPTVVSGNIFIIRLNRRNTNKVGDYIRIYSIKAELGSIATPFVDDDLTTKLLKCSRYLTKIPRLEHMRAVQAAGYNLYFNTKTPVCMRTRPTIISATENIQYNVTKIPLEVVTGYGLGVADYTLNNILLMCTKQGNTLMDGSLKILADIFLTAEI